MDCSIIQKLTILKCHCLIKTGRMTELPPLSPTGRTTLGRRKVRAVSDRATLYSVLDEALICHLGVVRDGVPMVLPTGYGRDGDTIYLHGSTGATSLR